MGHFADIFPNCKPIVGMIHVQALPGTPRHRLPLTTIIDQAVAEADTYRRAGLNAIAIENMHDVPYLKGEVGPEITAVMGVIGREIKRAVNLPCGVQILAGANKAALAVALAAGLEFVRVEGYIFGHVADEGWIEAGAGALRRYQRLIGAEHILIFADIKKKHAAHAMTVDVDIVETAKAAHFFMADAVIVTGMATGQPADLAEIQHVRQAVAIPVLVGSGVTADNVADYRPASDGLIVGSYFKRGGNWANEIDFARVEAFMKRASEIS